MIYYRVVGNYDGFRIILGFSKTKNIKKFEKKGWSKEQLEFIKVDTTKINGNGNEENTNTTTTE